MPPRVLVIGDLMSDITVRLSGPIAWGSDRRARIVVRSGGSAATQAAWLAKLGLSVDFVARLGAAEVAAESARLAAFGVTPHLIGDPNLETGRLVALVEPSGERSFLTDRGANDGLCEADIAEALVARAAAVVISGYSFLSSGPRAAAIGLIARARGREIAVDPGSAEFLREIGGAAFLNYAAGATMLFPNADEAKVLTSLDDPEAQGAALARRFPLVVLKRGAEGALAFQGENRWRAAAPEAKVVDTTGAGDAFLAAFLAAKLAGAETGLCLKRAVGAGAAATETFGGRPAV